MLGVQLFKNVKQNINSSLKRSHTKKPSVLIRHSSQHLKKITKLYKLAKDLGCFSHALTPTCAGESFTLGPVLFVLWA